MANKTLKDMFPDVSLNDDTQEESSVSSATKAANKAASELISMLEDDGTKDYHFNFRVNKKTYMQFSAICKKKGTRPSAILQMFMSDYVRENIDILD